VKFAATKPKVRSSMIRRVTNMKYFKGYTEELINIEQLRIKRRKPQ
jgi:hypothetical protein